MDAQLPNAVADWLAEQSLDESTVAELRKKYESVHFTYCMDDDVTAAIPVLERDTFNLYLIDGREHCLCFTTDLDIATGLVVAERMEEDE